MVIYTQPIVRKKKSPQGREGVKNKTWKKRKKKKKSHAALIKKLLTFYIMNWINF